MNDHDTGTEHHEHKEGGLVRAHQPNSPLREELLTHSPFSIASVALGLVLAGIICFLAPAERDVPADVHDHAAGQACTLEHDHGAKHDDEHGHGHDHTSGSMAMFHLFHPLHMFFSAAATTAMFRRYDKKALKAIIVGLAGAIGVCGISDIAMPHLSLLILGKTVPFHMCILENPGLVLPFAVIGVGVGLLAARSVSQSTFFSHSLHVFSSTMASIFYMVQGYSRLGWLDDLGWMFVFVILAVMIPCCLSDIVFPVAMSAGGRAKHSESACCH